VVEERWNRMHSVGVVVVAVSTGVVVIAVAVAVVLVVLFVTVSMRGRQKRASHERAVGRRELDDAHERAEHAEHERDVARGGGPPDDAPGR
jgi:Flp pilus assembly protein TadB